MITREKAIALRKLIEKLSADLSDSEAYTAPELFPMWTLKDYQTGDRVQYQSTLYKCLQAHTAQADWTPDTAVSHNGKHWQSDIDANVYVPGVYGWSEV